MADFGIDISSYQKGIDFSLLKNEGVKFAIIRAGFTGYGNGINKNKDSQFELFYQKCKEYNILVGSYWYSCADNYEKGKAEAEYMYENCLKGKKFEMPIYIDVEDTRWQQKAGKKLVTDAILGFCEFLEEKNYLVGVYANSNWFRNYIDINKIKKYEIWHANWGKTKPKNIECNLWQFGGSINYIRSNKVANRVVDQDYCYKDFSEFIQNNKLNGYSQKEESKKTILEIAYEVIQGKWDNGLKRKELLEKAGYNYREVQNMVNELLNHSNSNTNNTGIHIVKYGENLTIIAKKYNTTIQKIIELNKDVYPSLLENPNQIIVGWKLKI